MNGNERRIPISLSHRISFFSHERLFFVVMKDMLDEQRITGREGEDPTKKTEPRTE